MAAKEDRSEPLRNQIDELREEAAALADRAKRTAQQADGLNERIKRLETTVPKKKD
jgi:predicted nuclease with TOPRIM domain